MPTGHREIQKDDVGKKFCRLADRLAAVFGFSEHLAVRGCFQQLTQSVAHNGVIVDEQHRDFFHKAVASLPTPGEGSTRG